MSVYIYRIMWFLMASLCLNCYGTSSGHAVSKLFYHQGNLTDKLVCYVDGDPICNRISHQVGSDGHVHEVFFLPRATLSQEALSVAKKVMESDRGIATITIAEVDTPMKGVKVSFDFDPHKAHIDYAAFDAISRKKGIVFSIHDADRLQEMNLKTSPLLQLAMGKKKSTVIVDCGHGGHDSGKTGCFGIAEKDITLQVGHKLARRLQAEGYTVALTRESDSYKGLDERTSFANQHGGDLFISLHANGALNEQAQGLETWCLTPQLFNHPLQELAPAPAAHHRTQFLSEHSMRAAQAVHSTILDHIQPSYELKCRSVRHSVAQVLLGVEMPACLIELGFLSHPQEALQLQKNEYQHQLADAICHGINHYFKKSL